MDRRAFTLEFGTEIHACKATLGHFRSEDHEYPSSLFLLDTEGGECKSQLLRGSLQSGTIKYKQLESGFLPILVKWPAR